MAEFETVIVGAGVIGLSAAILAQEQDMTVTVLDAKGPAAGASAGNAGAFAFTDILPLASPGILRKSPAWLLDPLGPLSVPPAYALRIAPWLFRFWRACSPSRIAASTDAQAGLMDLSKHELEPFLRRTRTIAMLRREGNLQVYEGAKEFQDSLPGWEARKKHGIDFEHVTGTRMTEIQPGLAARFTHGTFTPGWYSIADPKLYTMALAEHFRSRGGTIRSIDVTALRPDEDGVVIHSSDGAARRARQVVVAAGAFSHRITSGLGESIPLETERGYNTTLPVEAFDLRTQVTFGGHGFVVTRLSSGIRVGGAVELGGLRLPPNFKRADAMLAKTKDFLPGIRTEGGVQWFGFRPSLPDSLPVIGYARRTKRVIYAFGHGHLGLTQSTGTARLVADLLANRPTAIDISPFSPQRFSTWRRHRSPPLAVMPADSR